MSLVLVVYLLGLMGWACVLSVALALGSEELGRVVASRAAKVGAGLAVLFVLAIWPIAIPVTMLLGAIALRGGDGDE